MLRFETSILKSIFCGVIFGAGSMFVFGMIYFIGLYYEVFTKEGYSFLITLFFLLVFVGPFFEDIINVIIQKRKFYLIGQDTITVGSKSLLNAEYDRFAFKFISIEIRFRGIACYEWIELHTASKKILIEKSELRNEDYKKIKKMLKIFVVPKR